MSGLLASELLKLRTTRTALALALALVLVTGIAAAGTVGATSEDEISSVDFQQDLPLAAAFATLFALLFGILVVTGEYRHGTITPTFLVSPVRERVLAAKALASALAGLVLAVASLAVTYAIAAPWLATRGATLDLLAGESGRRMLGLAAAAAFWGALGVGFGALVRSQVAAVLAAFAWFLIVEPLLGALVGDIAPYLPGSAVDALLRSDDADDPLGVWAGFGLSLAYALAFVLVGTILAARRDVN